MLVSMVVKLCSSTVRLVVMTESHPLAEINVSKYVPLVVWLEPPTKYDSPSQMLVSMVVKLCSSTVKLVVMTESQPLAEVNVS